MMREIAKLHILALPHTLSSRRGERFVEILYAIVKLLGYVECSYREGRVIGVVSGIGPWILTLVVSPDWQQRGIGSELLRKLPGRRYVYTEKCSVGFYEKMGFEKTFSTSSTIFLCRKS